MGKTLKITWDFFKTNELENQQKISAYLSKTAQQNPSHQLNPQVMQERVEIIHDTAPDQIITGKSGST